MDRKENIKNLYKQIGNLLSAEYAYHRLKKLTGEILDEIEELYKNENDPATKTRYSIAHDALFETYNREVEFVNEAERRVKPSAPKIRKSEYRNELQSAISHIHADIFEFIN